MFLVFVLVAGLVLVLQRCWLTRKQAALARKLKTNIMTLPIIGHSYKFLGANEDRMRALEDFGKDAIKCGGISKLLLTQNLFVCVADLVAAEVLLKECLEKHDLMKLFEYVVGNGSIVAPVPIWRPRRTMNAPIFNTEKIRQFTEIFSEHSMEMVDRLEQEADKGTFSLMKYTKVTSMNAVCESSMGFKINYQNNHFMIAIEELWKIATCLMFQPWLQCDFIMKLLPIYKTLLKHKLTLYNFLTKIIQEKLRIINDNVDHTQMEGKQKVSFLDVQLRTAEEAQKFTELELMEEIMVLVVAGYDTSSHTIAHVASLLSRHLDVQDKVYAELQDVFGDSDREATFEDLGRLTYLDAVIKETLRLYPTVPIVIRQVDKDVTLPSGLTIVKGCGVLVNIWAVHRNPGYWGEDAEQFRPERFLSYSPAHPAQYMPFSHGPRKCLGYRYAMVFMKCALATLLRRYRVVAPPGVAQGEPLRTKYEIMMRPVDDCEIRLARRTAVHNNK